MTKLSDLIKQRDDLDAQIVTARRAERQDAIAQIRKLMADHDLALDDLRQSGMRKTAPGVAVKYRDAETGNTWTGRGQRPRWLREALAAGHELDSFRI